MTSDPREQDPFGAAPPTAPGDPFGRPSTEPAAQPLGPLAASSPVPAGAVPAKRRGGGSGALVNLLLGVALVVAVGGVAFAVGRATAPASVAGAGDGNGRFGDGGGFFGPNASGAPNGNGGFAGGAGGILGGGGVSIEGTVTSVSADSITIQLANGQTVTIPTDAQTTYHSQSAATAADVKAGSTVLVQLAGGRGIFTGNGNGNTNGGNGGDGGPGGPTASGRPARQLPAARSITLAPAGS